MTERRIIIIEGAATATRNVRSIPLRAITDLTLSERADKNGSITFSTNNMPAYFRAPMQTMWSGAPWPGAIRSLALVFDPLADARKVYKLIREAQQAVSEPRQY